MCKDMHHHMELLCICNSGPAGHIWEPSKEGSRVVLNTVEPYGAPW